MATGGGGSAPYVPSPAIPPQLVQSGIPTSVVIYDQSLDNGIKKEIVYKELDRLPVAITDTNPLSPNYLRITYLPDEFKLGKNLIRIRPNIPTFVENTQLYIEIIDYNGDPIYYETELNSETDDTFIIISVYIYDSTPPGPCAVYILGTVKNVTIPERNKIYPVNYRWAQIINVNTTEKTSSPIIFTTLPTVSVLSNTASYDTLVYPGGTPFTSSTYNNIQLNNGLLDPSITPLNTYDKFLPAMYTGKLYVDYENIQLISPSKFDTTYLLGSGITASIKDYITNKSLTLDDPIVIYQQNRSEQIILDTALFTTASIAFEQSASIVLQSSFKKRILTVKFMDLDPFVGQIRSVKTFYRNTALSNTEYLLLSDFIVPSKDVYDGYNPISASFSLLLPDSEIDEYFDVRFEFYNNEIIPSNQILEIKNLLVQGTPKVTVAGSGILMVDTANALLDAKNMVRTLYQNHDTYTLYTSSYKLESNITVPIDDCKCCEPKLITQFTGFIEDGAPYITAYYNSAITNLTQQILPEHIGIYSYNTILEVYEMSTSSYSNFSYGVDEIKYPKLISSTASIQLSSDYPSGYTAFGYPIKHIVKLPQTNKLYRFALWHSITVPGSASYNTTFADFNIPASWSYSLLPGATSISAGTASIQLNAGQAGYLTQTLQSSLTAGQTYKISFDIIDYNAPLAGDYISVGLDSPPVSNTIQSSVSSSGQIINIGTYQYILKPNPTQLNKFYIYFNTGTSGGNPILNSYQVASTYIDDGFSTAVNVASPTLLNLGSTLPGRVPFTTISSTDARISLNSSRNFTANVPDTYTFEYNLNVSASILTIEPNANGGIYPYFKVYDSSNTLISAQTVPLTPANLYTDTTTTFNKNYTGTITKTLSTGDYIRFELYYIANLVGAGTEALVTAKGTFNLVDTTILGGASTFKICNIKLGQLSSTSASFETSCSIKDINVLSSGLLFVSGSARTNVVNAYDYYVPVV